MPDDEQQYRVVTPAQLSEGYFLKDGAFIYERRYQVVRQLPDGNWLVCEPRAKEKA